MRRPSAGRLFRVIVVGVVALGFLFAGCTTGGGSPGPQRTLTIGATLEPPALDPTTNNSASIPQLLLYNVYETLVKLDSQGRLRPLLAQRWDVSPDRLTYRFYLDPGAKFASGKPVTAAAVVQNIDRIRDPATVSVWAEMMKVVASAEAIDDRTVQVTLSRPSNTWLFNMSSSVGIIADPDGFSDLRNKTAGSGPYQLDSWTRGDSIALSANHNYWGTPSRFDKVIFRYFSDPNAMNSALASGSLDIISNVQAPEALGQFADETRFSVLRGTTNGEVVLGMNHTNAALKSVTVRQAIASAINRKSLMETVWNGEGTLIGSMAVPTDPWYEDLTALNPYDVAASRKFLQESGYATGLNLRLRVPATAYARKSAEFVASALKEVGINVTIHELEFSVWYSEVFQKADYDLTIVAHVEPRDVFKFAEPTYYWRYNNTDFQKLVATADEVSEEQQLLLMRQAVRLLATDVAAVWLFALPNLVVTRAGISGVPENATSLSFDVTTIATR